MPEIIGPLHALASLAMSPTPYARSRRTPTLRGGCLGRWSASRNVLDETHSGTDLPVEAFNDDRRDIGLSHANKGLNSSLAT